MKVRERLPRWLDECLPEFRRLTLERADGRVYLDRWGIGIKNVGSLFLHRMDAPDPGVDLHDHPWPFLSLVLRGGYTEQLAGTDTASLYAWLAEWKGCIFKGRGVEYHRRAGSLHLVRLARAHRIIDLDRTPTWTLVLTGPVRRKPWGFYLPTGWVDQYTYDATVRADRRDMVADDRKYPTTGR